MKSIESHTHHLGESARDILRNPWKRLGAVALIGITTLLGEGMYELHDAIENRPIHDSSEIASTLGDGYQRLSVTALELTKSKIPGVDAGVDTSDKDHPQMIINGPIKGKNQVVEVSISESKGSSMTDPKADERDINIAQFETTVDQDGNTGYTPLYVFDLSKTSDGTWTMRVNDDPVADSGISSYDLTYSSPTITEPELHTYIDQANDLMLSITKTSSDLQDYQ